MSRTTMTGLIGLMILGLLGCSDGSQTVMSPDLEPGLVVATFETTSCPSVQETCDAMTEAVTQACPDEDFRNYGQLNSCRMHAVDEQMKALPDCYTGSQKLNIKKQVMIAVGLADYVNPPAHPTGTKLAPHMN